MNDKILAKALVNLEKASNCWALKSVGDPVALA